MSHRHEGVGHEVAEPPPVIAQDVRATLVTMLQRIVGADHVLTDPDVTVSYETNWTGRRYSAATAVVRPGSTDEVCAVIAACVGAGVTLSRLQEHVRAAGLEVGVDFGARDSATAGSGLT